MSMGPSNNSEAQLIRCYENGIRILRFNFPHYTQETTKRDVAIAHAVEQQVGGKFQLLLDTEGPEIRTGVLETPITYSIGEIFKIYIRENHGDPKGLFCDYLSLVDDVKIGGIVKIDAGLLDVEVLEKGSEYIVVKALNNFVVGSRRHLNLPGVRIKLPGLTERDKKNVLLAIEQKFDYIALSFTRKADDVIELRNFLKTNGGEQIKIIAKIENQEGVDNVSSIIDASDMIMVARGDLGTELPVEMIPIHQMNIVKSCKIKNTPVIVATQMLESMISNPVPTRAEVSDIFYAVREGAEYVMLSGETAIGKYPIECIKVMNKVITEAEKYK
ncbi:MAG: pyruvate kinase [candidate division SR1 bacterium]|nr:pyruvate kinase [candidate division SR1 bacterium]